MFVFCTDLSLKEFFVMTAVSGNLKLGLYVSNDPCSFHRKPLHCICLCPSYTMKQEWFEFASSQKDDEAQISQRFVSCQALYKYKGLF